MESFIYKQSKEINLILKSLKSNDQKYQKNYHLLSKISAICSKVDLKEKISNDIEIFFTNLKKSDKEDKTIVRENPIDCEERKKIISISNKILINKSQTLLENEKIFDYNEISKLSNRIHKKFFDNTKLSSIQLFKEEKSCQDSQLYKSNSSIESDKISLDSLFFSKEIKMMKCRLNNELSEKEIMNYLSQMSSKFIWYLYLTFAKLKSVLNKNFDNDLNFLYNFKQFILDIGISNSDHYEECIREVLYIKKQFKFSNFLNIINFVLKKKNEKNFLKYKLCLKMVNLGQSDKYIHEDIGNFFKLLNSKNIYDERIYKTLKEKMIKKYMNIFSHSIELRYKKLCMILELFFLNN